MIEEIVCSLTQTSHQTLTTIIRTNKMHAIFTAHNTYLFQENSIRGNQKLTDESVVCVLSRTTSSCEAFIPLPMPSSAQISSSTLAYEAGARVRAHTQAKDQLSPGLTKTGILYILCSMNYAWSQSQWAIMHIVKGLSVGSSRSNCLPLS